MKRVIGSSVLGLLSSVLVFGCGASGTDASSTSGTTSGSGSVTLTTTVKSPTSTSASVSSSLGKSAGISASKGVSASASSSQDVSKKVSVVKASAAESLASGATCKCLKADGTVLATSKSGSDGKVSFKIEPTDLDSSKSAIIECDAGGKKLNNFATVDVTSGEKVLEDTTTKSTTAFTQILLGAGVKTYNSDLKKAFEAGTIKPLAVFRSTLEPLKAGSVSAGTGSAMAAIRAMEEAMSNCMAGGTCSGGFDFMYNLQSGDASALSVANAQGLGIDFSAAATQAGSYPGMMARTCNDATLFSKMQSGGDEFFKSMGLLIGNQTAAELTTADYRVFQGYALDGFNDAASVGTAAFAKWGDASSARVIGKMGGQANMYATLQSAGFDELDSLCDSLTVGSSSDISKWATTFANYFGSAGSDSSKLGLATSNPSSLLSTWSGSLDAYADSSNGTAVFSDFFVMNGQGTSFSGKTMCTASSACSAKVCSSLAHWCIPSSVDATCSEYGCKCSVSSDCSSGQCDSSAGECTFPSAILNGTSTTILAKLNEACTSNAGCYSGVCSGGACVGYFNASSCTVNNNFSDPGIFYSCFPGSASYWNIANGVLNFSVAEGVSFVGGFNAFELINAVASSGNGSFLVTIKTANFTASGGSDNQQVGISLCNNQDDCVTDTYIMLYKFAGNALVIQSGITQGASADPVSFNTATDLPVVFKLTRSGVSGQTVVSSYKKNGQSSFTNVFTLNSYPANGAVKPILIILKEGAGSGKTLSGTMDDLTKE